MSALEAAEAAELRTRTVTWSDPMPVAAAALGGTGLEFMQAIARGEVPPPPIAALLGMGLDSIEEGKAVFRIDVGEHLYNPIGSVHGGVFATMLDSCMGCAVHSSLPAGRAYTTIDLTVSYLRPLTVATPEVFAEGTVVSSGRRVATATGRIVDPDGRIYATGTTTCLVFDTPTPA